VSQPERHESWLIRKAQDAPFDSVPGSIVGPATDNVEVVPASQLEQVEKERDAVRWGYGPVVDRLEARVEQADSLADAVERFIHEMDAALASYRAAGET
jgi:hypothetical protein